MKSIEEISKELEMGMDHYISQSQDKIKRFNKTHDNEYLTKDDMLEMATEATYMFSYMKDIVDYLKDLKDNQK